VVLIGLTGVALNPAMVARVMAAAMPGPLVNTLHTWVITAGLAVGGLGGWRGHRHRSGFASAPMGRPGNGAAGAAASCSGWLCRRRKRVTASAW